MDNSAEEARSWWVFYPLRGLEILDDEPALDRPLFGDSTVVSKRHIDHLANLMDSSAQKGGDLSGMTRQMLSMGTFNESFDSFVAVKRRLGINREEAKHGKSPTHQLATSSQRRASEVASGIALGILARSSLWQTCGLVEQVRRRIKTITMICPESGAIAFHAGEGGTHGFVDSDRAIRLTRAQLTEQLESPPVAPLSSVLLTQGRAVPRPLSRAISEAAIRLSDAIHTIDAAGQVLGAITAIEILLSNFGDPFEHIRRRVASLIGDEAFYAFDGKGIFRARNLYVHRGEGPPLDGTAVRATGMALNCLLIYSSLARLLPSKGRLISYLDFMCSAGRIGDLFSAEERDAFTILRKHDPSSVAIPVFNKLFSPGSRANPIDTGRSITRSED